MPKNTLNGTKRKTVRTSGFRARIKTKQGKQIIKQRRKKGRKTLTISK